MLGREEAKRKTEMKEPLSLTVELGLEVVGGDPQGSQGSPSHERPQVWTLEVLSTRGYPQTW